MRCDLPDNQFIGCSVDYNIKNVGTPMPDKLYLSLTDEQRLTVASLLTTLQGAGIVKDEIDFQRFVSGCFFRGLWEYKKDVVRNDC